MKFVATTGGRVETVDVDGEPGRYHVQLGERVWEVDARLMPEGLCSLIVDGVSYVAAVSDHDGNAAKAASTAARASPSFPLGAESTTSPVAGLMTS